MEKQISEKEKDKLLKFSKGKNLKQITKELLTAYDKDEIDKKAQSKSKDVWSYVSPAEREKLQKEAQEELILQASSTFNGKLNEVLAA